MGKRVGIALMVLGLALAGVIAWRAWQRREPEPVYKGKPLSSWLIALRTSAFSSEAQEQAKAAVQQAGTNAIPTLLRMLRAKDSSFKLKLLALLKRQHIIRINYSPAADWNWVAEFGFYALGTNGQSAEPSLLEIANQNISPTSHGDAIFSLGSIGPLAKESVPSLFQWATNANGVVRLAAILSLDKILAGPDRVHLLTNAVHDSDAGVRYLSVEALGQLGVEGKFADPALVVPLLMNAVHDSDAGVRYYAIKALEKFGQDAELAVPALVLSLNDPDWEVRGYATNALKAIDPEAAAKAGITNSAR